MSEQLLTLEEVYDWISLWQSTQIKNFIEKGKKELKKDFEENWNDDTFISDFSNNVDPEKIEHWIEYKFSSRQVSLIKMIVEGCCKDCQNKIQSMYEKQD